MASLTDVGFLLALLLFVTGGSSLDNGVARTPPMGWNSWYDLAGGTSVVAMNESMVMRTADAMVALGLRELGLGPVLGAPA